MSKLSDFFGSMEPCTSIVNSTSAGTAVNLGYDPPGIVKSTLSGALDAGVYSAALVDVAGSGYLTYCALNGVDATSRTLTLKVVLDGVIVYEATSAALTNAQTYMLAAGCATPTGFVLDYIPFLSSLKLYVKSSLGETDKLKLWYQYFLT